MERANFLAGLPAAKVKIWEACTRGEEEVNATMSSRLAYAVIGGAVGATAYAVMPQEQRDAITPLWLDPTRAEREGKAACRPVILCGPSGVGKSTLIHRLQVSKAPQLHHSVA